MRLWDPTCYKHPKYLSVAARNNKKFFEKKVAAPPRPRATEKPAPKAAPKAVPETKKAAKRGRR